jgi:hypothetical protein
MTTPTRRRCFAYERKDGSVCYLTKALHDSIQARPHTIGLYQLKQWLGVSRLLTGEDYRSVGWMGLLRPAARQPAAHQAGAMTQ